MAKGLAFLYGLIAYAIFFVTFLYAVAFVGNVIVPKTIDSGATTPIADAILVDVLLLGLFAVQHSVMARPGFKHWWTHFVPAPVERSTYVLLTSLCLILMYWQWRPLTNVVWDVHNPAGRTLLQALFWLGWLIVLASTFMIDHFDLFGLRQVYFYLRGREYVAVGFKAPLLYKYCRHPLLLGFLIAFWAAPHMTTGHAMFAAVTTAYILLAIQLEEHDLIVAHGERYQEYRGRTSMLLPMMQKSKPAPGSATGSAGR
ncbi:MAG TPA: NnrU family protein [Terriglobales bacterium]|nr:NnrU family protein [Terriglobales bacterium]